MYVQFHLLKSYNQGKGLFLKQSTLGVTCKLMCSFL